MNPGPAVEGKGAVPSHLAIILDQPAIGPEWKSWLTYELALRGLLLGTDGTVKEDRTLLGFFRFLGVQECEAVLRATRVEVHARECPWAGPMRGALGWEDAGSGEALLNSFIPVLIRRSRGPLIRLEDGVHHEPLRQVTFSLSNLTGKFGFEDGEALLCDSSDYLEYARNEAQAALTRAGLEAQVSITQTAHNPLRIWGDVTRNGKKISETVLQDFSMTLWAFDWSCLRDETFW
ncbi:hypothetical protein [Stigmatella aurantiaca]|uniref:Uncharacterized protein n=1 Tax=Stigmatella aurantiaca (strain DW4/3-1) TaxID=378806 RepID=E3FU35_STIAD|nr:hypothetical protein [Stigmatella aurantiaca]ADO72175.1 uncharacterized protein STAUR_4395 [Stigmatella aurantiaca DW4/3-1]